MSKKVVEDTELQKLTLSPTNTNEDETSIKIEEPVRPPRHSLAGINQPPILPSLPERRKSERLHTTNNKSHSGRVPSFKITNNSNQNSTKVNSSNEVKEGDKRTDRSPQHSSQGQKRAVLQIHNMNSNSALKSQMKQTPLNIRMEELTGTSLFEKQINGDSNPKLKSSVDLFSNTNWGTSPIASPSGKSSKNVGFSRHHNGANHAYGDSSAFSPKNPTSRRPILNNPSSGIQSRPCPHHSFLTDAQDVRQIEQGLLQLMEDFQTGNLRAFGKDSRLRQMEEIREQQEKLAKMHFDVGAEQDLVEPLSKDGLQKSEDGMRLLMENLAHLSIHIENLDTNTHPEKDQSTRNSGDNGLIDAHKESKPPNKPARKSLTSPPIIESSLHNKNDSSLPPPHSPPQLRKTSKD